PLSFSHVPPPIHLFSFSLHYALQYLHSFPTRRSSDLIHILCMTTLNDPSFQRSLLFYKEILARNSSCKLSDISVNCAYEGGQIRSEEHTSELQSRFDLVCRLLLEKKNNRLQLPQ